MATKKTSKSSDAPKITRISASGGSSSAKTKKSTAATTAVKKAPEKVRPKKVKKVHTEPRRERGILGYFVGAWRELKEVRWPDRRATWGMTGALLAFTAFFVVIILLLDALFQWLFDLVIG